MGADDLAELTWVGVRNDSSGVLPELAQLEGGARLGNENPRVARFEWAIPGDAKDCRSVYLRVVQADGERAWGSPMAMRRGQDAAASVSGRQGVPPSVGGGGAPGPERVASSGGEAAAALP